MREENRRALEIKVLEKVGHCHYATSARNRQPVRVKAEMVMRDVHLITSGDDKQLLTLARAQGISPTNVNFRRLKWRGHTRKMLWS
jgi:hypothetical protein